MEAENSYNEERKGKEGIHEKDDGKVEASHSSKHISNNENVDEAYDYNKVSNYIFSNVLKSKMKKHSKRSSNHHSREKLHSIQIPFNNGADGDGYRHHNMNCGAVVNPEGYRRSNTYGDGNSDCPLGGNHHPIINGSLQQYSALFTSQQLQLMQMQQMQAAQLLIELQHRQDQRYNEMENMFLEFRTIMDSFKKSLKSHAENLGMKRTLHFHSDKRYNDVNDGDSRESFVENEESLMKKPKM